MTNEGQRQNFVSKFLYTTGPMALWTAWRITAECVSQWCDAYEVQEVSRGETIDTMKVFPGRSGELPADATERSDVIWGIFDWLEKTRGFPDPSVIFKSHGEGILVAEGNSFILTLTAAQFGALQECWQRHGLPRDLCFPTSVSREAADPLPWGQDEYECRERFMIACVGFLGSLSRRHLELLDMGADAPVDPEEERLLSELSTLTGRAWANAARLALRRATAGGSRSPD